MKKKYLLLALSFYCSILFAQNPSLLSQATAGGVATVSQIVSTQTGNAFYNVVDYNNPFSTNRALWTTNGTKEGTQKLTLSDGHFLTSDATLLTPLDNNRILLAGDNSQGYGEVWVSDGTQQGTFGLQSFQPGAGVIPVQAIGAINGIGIYAAVSGDGVLRLHSTQGSAYGDTTAFYSFPSSIASVAYFKSIAGVMYFEANNQVTHNNEIWRTDGTTAGTYLVKDLTANGLTSAFMSFNGSIYFITISSTLGDYIWKSDGTPNGTTPLKQLATSFQSDDIFPSYTATSSALYFAAGDGVHGKEVWTTDGSNAGTHMVADLFPGITGSNPSSLVTLNDILYLSANNGSTGQELFTYNGSTLSLVKDIYAGGTGSNPSSLVVNNNSIVFSAKPGETEGTELWVSGGTANTTFEMANIAKPSSASSSPSLITAGTKNFFTGNYDINGDGQNTEQCVFVYIPPAKIWTGNVSTDVSAADNWFPSGAPASTDDVVIPASSTPNSVTNPFLFVNSFYNNGGIVKNNNGLILINGDFYNEGTINADVNTSVLAIVSPTAAKTTHRIGSPGTYNGKLILSGSINAKLSGDIKVTDLRVEGADSIYINDYNLTTDYFELSTPKVITNGYGKLFMPVSNSNVLFPVSSDSLSYTPVIISNANGIPDYFGVNVKNGVLTEGFGGDTLTQQAVNKTWDIGEQTPGGSIANVTFQWQATDELSPFDRSQVYAAHYTNNAWDNGMLISASGSNPYSVTRSGITSFSPFAVFSSSSVLPVTFTTFSARLSGKDVSVSWQASDDNNIRHYNVQRSLDGRTFTTIGEQVQTGGNISHMLYYTDINAASLPTAKTLYYRLQSVDASGNVTLSKTAPVTLPASSSFRVWPLPVTSVLHAAAGSELAGGKAVVYNAAGKPVLYFSMNGNVQVDVSVAALPAGEYFITLYTNTHTASSRFIKK